MLVKDIVRVSAEYLELKDVVEYLDNKIEKTDEVEEELNSFVLAVNMVNSGIASSYIELVATKELYPDKSNKILYGDIDKKGIIEIKNIVGSSGSKIAFKVMPDGVILENNCICNVEYSYFPSSVVLDDNIDYYLKINKYIFAMGVVAEYLYIKGNVDDAYMWDKRFKNSMMNVLRPRRNITIPERRW